MSGAGGIWLTLLALHTNRRAGKWHSPLAIGSFRAICAIRRRARTMLDQLYWNVWAQAAVVALLLAIVSGLADWRRIKRRNLNAVGFMPWTAISAMALLIAVLSAAVAFQQA